MQADIEFADELQRVVDDIPADLAGLCLDTGHMAYSGMDPAVTLRKYWDRVDYIHFKDSLLYWLRSLQPDFLPCTGPT